MVYTIVANKGGQVFYDNGQAGAAKLTHYRPLAQRYASQEAASKRAQYHNRWSLGSGMHWAPVPLSH